MTSTTWKLKELEQWIETNRPEDKQTVALPRSLGRSSFIIKYHANLAKEAFAEFNKESDNHRSMMVAMLSLKPAFAMAALAHEANIIATIHTVRNYADIFAQLVNSLTMAKPLKEKDCTFGRVASGIAESALKQGMLDLNSSYSFRYLAAFSNISKHRRLIQSKPSVNFEENASGLKVEAFSYAFSEKEPDTAFSQRWGHDLLEETLNVYRRILELGQHLNAQLFQS
ncbi:hypothetical protein [Pseudomonas aeruginosa]|uniref:hypothetical protein n=1 Tax=Pseudomonas aeruginosa TaxID=287 RepID=UPI001BD1F7AF|nr:hypothetical protein [Pseudomonas aeruginosa]MBX6237442.1 hypothetical protein [Pseudomonas aeruginosa]MDI4002697.1 hypothetical protein [Pseudomonas aeruginosa]MDV7897665.1 hypothetical protein [Pseudomonas aeruginosa]